MVDLAACDRECDLARPRSVAPAPGRTPHPPENFLQQGLALVDQEPGTVRWFALRFGTSSFGICDAFGDDSGRRTHLSGPVAQALADNTGVLFEQPTIEPVDVIAEKPPI